MRPWRVLHIAVPAIPDYKLGTEAAPQTMVWAYSLIDNVALARVPHSMLRSVRPLCESRARRFGRASIASCRPLRVLNPGMKHTL